MNKTDNAGSSPLKWGFTREETARVIGQSPAALDRLAKRGLIYPPRGTRRPISTLVEIERYLRATTSEVERQGPDLFQSGHAPLGGGGGILQLGPDAGQPQVGHAVT